MKQRGGGFAKRSMNPYIQPMAANAGIESGPLGLFYQGLGGVSGTSYIIPVKGAAYSRGAANKGEWALRI